MSTSNAEDKQLVNALYHGAVIAALSMGYAQLGKAIFKVAMPKLDLNAMDIGMVGLDVTAASAIKGMLVKQGLIPVDIMK